MASILRHKSGWRAQIAIRGVRKSRVFERKQDAKDWAAREEYLIRKGEGEYGPGTLGDLLDRYARTVSPAKRGARWEQIRLELLKRDKLADIQAKDARPGDFAEWRDRRLEQVSASTVRREMILLSAVMSVAVDEWGVFPVSPVKGVKKPRSAPPRDRLVTDEEIEKLRQTAKPGLEAEAIRAFECACLTGMRAGELLSATREGRIASIPMTKNGEARQVPLSSRAVELFGDGFSMKSAQLDTAFRRVRDRAGIDGLTFHDSRHRCITDLARILDPLALARVVGHKDLRQLQTYYSESAESLAQRLDG
jgi:integrase